jgi:hypothetical protein
MQFITKLSQYNFFKLKKKVSGRAEKDIDFVKCETAALDTDMAL